MSWGTDGEPGKEALGEAFAEEDDLGLDLLRGFRASSGSQRRAGSWEERRTKAPLTPLHLGSLHRTTLPSWISGWISSLVYCRLHTRHSASANEPGAHHQLQQ